MVNLKNRSFLKLLDFTPEEIQYLLDLSAELKADKKAGREHKTLIGKNIPRAPAALSRLQPMTRARTSPISALPVRRSA